MKFRKSSWQSLIKVNDIQVIAKKLGSLLTRY